MPARTFKNYPGGWLHRALEAVYGRLFRVIAATGKGPSFIVILETRGGRSGGTHSTVHILAEYGGARFLVAVMDYSDWVRNVRAASGEAIMRHGKHTTVKLEEVRTDERAPILKAYLKWALGARSIFKLSPASPIEKFEEIAAKHPVFKILEV